MRPKCPVCPNDTNQNCSRPTIAEIKKQSSDVNTFTRFMHWVGVDVVLIGIGNVGWDNIFFNLIDVSNLGGIVTGITHFSDMNTPRYDKTVASNMCSFKSKQHLET